MGSIPVGGAKRVAHVRHPFGIPPNGLRIHIQIAQETFPGKVCVGKKKRHDSG